MTPADQPMCGRLVMGTGFYKQFHRPGVSLVDAPIERVEAQGIRTTDGVLHELDVIVLATGFDAHRFVKPMELVGRDGVRLSDVWDREPYGYRSVAIPDFPNVFMLIGPHSPFGNQSLFAISETQAVRDDLHQPLAPRRGQRHGPDPRGDRRLQRTAARGAP